ncbi:chromosome partitioning protein [Xanthomonas sacchari]|uniref:ParA family protein n=1 Tax=Xanthomonas sacchari TaxID=56458 RepID=UPI00277FECFE|nr:ParA family protein [Xanthomonas sacchari]MDQ1094242.1 chromosome partitioning protein [Xanthomonas sacchari]
MVKDTKTKAPVVAVLNMKGGVGKTTISANVMRQLYRQVQKRVVLVDFDPQFNLTQTLFNQDRYEKLKKDKRTVLSVMESEAEASLFKVTTASSLPPKLDDVAVTVRKMNEATLKLVPGDFGLVKYSLIDDPKALLPVKARFRQFIANTQDESDLVCIDCNPSSSFMTVCSLEVASHVLVPVRPDRFSILGLELLDSFVNDLPTLKVKPKFVIVLNDIPRQNYDPTVENQLRAHPSFGKRTLSTPLYHSGVLVASPGYTGFATDKKVAYAARATSNVLDLAKELAEELGVIK